MALIERCFEGEAVPMYAFLLKILFTAVALGAGFKGGEIVPTLCVGAVFGCTAGTHSSCPGWSVHGNGHGLSVCQCNKLPCKHHVSGF